MRLYKQKLWQEYKFIRNRLCLGRGKGERGKRHLLPLSQPSEDSGEPDGSLGQQGFHLPSWPPGVGVTILPSPAEPGPPHRAVEGGLSPTPHTAHGLGQGSGLQGFLPRSPPACGWDLQPLGGTEWMEPFQGWHNGAKAAGSSGQTGHFPPLWASHSSRWPGPSIQARFPGVSI